MKDPRQKKNENTADTTPASRSAVSVQVQISLSD